ncbi:VaFE repeat-containing surface-anchored protein [Cumulibacter soli]|uniref:VaFE repeat-containing surface-anchored protein n=1 Tax=Cumulibacter soli TaxID=2546344 RepID=UPI0014193B3F|nr:VaFE repeat-containing surface-anchored protein [Cumulibacter soli]
MRRWLAVASAAVLAFAGVLTSSMAAGADIEVGDEVWVGHSSANQGYGGTALFPIYSPVPDDLNNPGEPDLWAYCIEHNVEAGWGREGVVHDVADYLGDNNFTDPAVQQMVYWVLAHSYPAMSLEEFGAAAGVPGISANDAIEATQYAIWRYTDLSYDAPWAWETADSEAAYWYLVNGANASGGGLQLEDIQPTVSITGPTEPQEEGTLVGPFTVSTNQPSASVHVNPTFTLADASGDPIDPSNVVDGQQFYLDLRSYGAEGSAYLTASASGSSSTGKIVNIVPGVDDDPHAQTIILVTPHTTTVDSSVTVSWTGKSSPVLNPSIGTSLVDQADGDRVLPAEGGTVVDTVTYEQLQPNTEYTLTGELMDKATGEGTGITGSTTFTTTGYSGSVDVEFTVPVGFAGKSLVAFEYLTLNGEQVASHEDIDDPAQTVTVEAEVVLVPSIGTSLVDQADGDRVLPAEGGTVVDTVSYEQLLPDTEYTLTGELMDKATGEGTGITGSTTFTSSATGAGSVDVEFTVPVGFAGKSLVAFEYLTLNGEQVASHEDIDDPAQTVTVEAEDAPTTPNETEAPTDGDGDSPSDGSPNEGPSEGSPNDGSSDDVVPSDDVPSPELAQTGFSLAPMLSVAGILLAAGLGAAFIGHRTRNS